MNSKHASPTPDSRLPNPWPLAALTLLFVLGFALRLWQTRESLWIDELHTAWCALGSLGEVAPRAAMGNQSPLYFWLEWLLVRIGGASELTLRLPSVIAGSLLPVAIYWLTTRWTRSAWLGVFSAALVVVDHLAIFYATEARPYALIQLLAVLHIALVAELAERPTLRLRIGFVLGAALLFYLHYTTALLIAAEVVFLVIAIIRCRERPPWLSVAVLAIDLFLLSLLLIPAAANLLAIYARRENWAAFVEQKSVWTIFSLLPWSASIVVVILGVVLTHWLPKRGRESFAASDAPNGESTDRKRIPTPFTSPLPPAPTLLTACWLFVPLALAWATTATDTARLFFPRYLVASAPAAFVLTAFCLRLIPWRYVQVSLAAALLVYATYSSQIVQQLRYDGRIIGDRQEDWRGAVAWLNEELADNDYPILLQSGLIEAHALYSSLDADLYDYCLYPLRSLYPVRDGHGKIAPMKNEGRLSEYLHEQVRKRQGCWVICRWSNQSRPALEWTLRMPFHELQRRSNPAASIPGFEEEQWPPWRVVEKKSFGSVDVFLLKPGPKSPHRVHGPAPSG